MFEVNFEKVLHFFLVPFVDFEQINVTWDVIELCFLFLIFKIQVDKSN